MSPGLLALLPFLPTLVAACGTAAQDSGALVEQGACVDQLDPEVPLLTLALGEEILAAIEDEGIWEGWFQLCDPFPDPGECRPAERDEWEDEYSGSQDLQALVGWHVHPLPFWEGIEWNLTLGMLGPASTCHGACCYLAGARISADGSGYRGGDR